jgi:hypothetical protein
MVRNPRREIEKNLRQKRVVWQPQERFKHFITRQLWKLVAFDLDA